MSGILLELLPYIIGAGFAPVWIIITLLLLRGPGGAATGGAFVGGLVLVRLLQGYLASLLYSGIPNEQGEGQVVASTLIMVVGFLLLITGIRKWRYVPDAAEPPPAWMTKLSTITPLRALGVGALAMALAPKMWVFTGSAIGVIRGNALQDGQAAAAFLVYVFGSSLFVLLPVLATAVAPEWSAGWLGRLGDWLEAHNRSIVIIFSLIFGLFFLWKGLGGLLG